MLQQLFSGRVSFETIIAEILAVLVIIFLILPFHEWAHAFTASCLGDKGIKQRGRLSLNPLSHIDPIGALCMILFGFGWAKPVPIDSRNFKNPKLGMAITALMGPVANLVAGFVGMIAIFVITIVNPSLLYSVSGVESSQFFYNALPVCFYPGAPVTVLGTFLSFYVSVNINLAVFNLLPIPPLDGSKILFAFLPDRAVEFCYRYQMFFFIALFALISFGPLRGLLSYLSNALLQGMSWLAALPFNMIS